MNDVPLMVCRNMTKTYHSGEHRLEALKRISFIVSRGEFIALKGPSGSGKSTLLNICGMLDQCDEGEYIFEGKICSDSQQRTLIRRHKIGFVFQNFGLIPVMSAYDNIEYPLLLAGMAAKERLSAVQWILDAVGISEFRHHLPDRLSGGQRQRVAIARALVKRPPLVIADEPTANLDTATAESVIDLMKSLCRETGATFLIATHDDRMSDHCPRTLTLTDGVLS